MQYCKACSKEVEQVLFELDAEIIKAIIQENPKWVEADGVCTKCLDYYRSLMKMGIIFRRW
jgi:hypothetical protein